MKPYTITAGHGGSVPGSMNPKEWQPGATYFGYQEAILMADLRNIVALKLREKGKAVRVDGEGKANDSLTYAMNLVFGSEVALELHTNALKDPRATGVEVIAAPGQRELAQKVAIAIGEVLGLPLRGERGWLREELTAVGQQGGRLGFIVRGGLIVETFFISNPGDLAIYLQRKWLVAQAIVDAIT